MNVAKKRHETDVPERRSVRWRRRWETRSVGVDGGGAERWRPRWETRKEIDIFRLPSVDRKSNKKFRVLGGRRGAKLASTTGDARAAAARNVGVDVGDAERNRYFSTSVSRPKTQ